MQIVMFISSRRPALLFRRWNGVTWQSRGRAQHPDLSKFLTIGALLFIIGVPAC